ncbi:protein SRG1 [Tanacetum coccineum]
MAALPLNVGHIPDVLELKNGTKAEIPDRFVRDVKDRPLLTIPSHLSSSIPVIDLSKLMKGNKEEFDDEMLKFTASCEEWGFFQVINHGIDLDLLDKMEKLALEFFMLPIEKKQKYQMIPGGKVQGYGQAFVFSEDQKLDWCNMYALCIQPDYMRSPELWTTNPPAFGNTLDTYSSELKKLLKELLRFVALSLGLNDNIFEEMFGVPVHSIRMNYYPPCPRPDLVMGLSPHSDGSALTLLQQNKDSSVGLQILKNKTWVPVQLVPNALVINIGDTIEVLTNGRYKSVEHRAVTDKENDRLTLVTFYAPSYHIDIAPMPQMVDDDNPAKYRKYNHGEYSKHYIVTTSRYVVLTGRVKVPTGRYVVPTGRVKVPAGRYVVPTGKDNVIVSAGRTKVIPAGRTILVLKDEYEKWAMKMEYWIMNSDHNFGNIDLKWKQQKRQERDPKGIIMITSSAFLVWRNDESKKMRKSMLKQEFSEFRVSESEGLHKGYDRNLEIGVKSCFKFMIQELHKINHLQSLYPLLHQELDLLAYGKLDLRNKTIKWQIAMLSIELTDLKRKLVQKVGSHARECTGKQLDSKARYSAFKLKELDKSEEPKALLSVDSMLNWSDHEGEDEEKGAAQVYGMIAGDDDDAGDASSDVSDAAAEFALMGLSSQVQAYKNTLQTLEQQKAWYQSNQLALEERIRILTADLENTTNMLKYTKKLNDQVKLEESKARFDKWKESSKNLHKLINSSMSTRTKFGLGFGETFGSDEVFDPSAPSIFDTTPEDVEGKPLYDRFDKAVGMHAVPPPITGTFMPPSNRPDLDDTQFTYGSKSNNSFETNSVSNDFVSCDNSDKSSDSETTGFASCVSSVKSSSSKTNEPLASAPSSVDFKTVSETPDQQPSSTNDDSSFSFKENVKPPRNLCNKSGINSRSLCKRKSFGSKTCFIFPHFVPKAHMLLLGSRNRPTSVLAGSRNRPTFVPAGSRNRPTSVPAGSRNRPTSVPAGRPFSAGWKNHDNPHKNKDLGIVDLGIVAGEHHSSSIIDSWRSHFTNHEGEDEEKGAAQVYGMIAGDDDDAASDASGDVSDAAAEFALMGLSSQVKLKARFDKWKKSSKNLDKLINSSMSSRLKFGLGFRETFGSDEVFDPSAPSIFDTTPEDVEGKCKT